MTSGPWTVRITASAEADFQEILEWTSRRFGEAQANAYAETLIAAFDALTLGPSAPGVKSRDDILKGLYCLHVARGGHRGRHFVMFRMAPAGQGRVIEVLRLLHDAMDLPLHFPPRAG